MSINFNNFKVSNYKPSRDDYTKGQLKALDMIFKWFASDELIFTLSGFAGTGKTTILKDVVKYIKGSIACTAPTHKALRIAENNIGVTGSTIHKLLGLRPNFDLKDFDFNKPQFDPLGNVYIKNHILVIVDEASMINVSLDKFIKQESAKYKVKILYCGDPYQLPPVGEKFSMVFYNKNIVHLDEIVRQGGNNPLIKLLTLARNDVKHKTNTLVEAIFRAVKENKYGDYNGDVGYMLTTDKHHFNELMIDHFKTNEFENDIDYCKYTAFTNDSIIEYNNFIRNAFFGETEVLIKHDLLTSYTTTLDEFMSPILLNSEDYIIEDIMQHTNKYFISGYLVKLKAVNSGKVTKSWLFVVNHKDPENVARYVTAFNALVVNAKKAKISNRRKAWEAFYEFKNYNLLLANITTHEGNLITSKSIDYGFGLTVHKTQGSTYNNIFINLRDITYNKMGTLRGDFNLRNRLLYVALSRATNAAFIYV